MRVTSLPPPPPLSLSLSPSLSLTHTHTHTHTLYISLSLSLVVQIRVDFTSDGGHHGYLRSVAECEVDSTLTLNLKP